MTGPIDRYPLPGNEDYKARILEIVEASKPDFNGKVVDVFTAKFDILSFKDGGALEDINGDAVDSRWIWKDIDPARMGFKQDGTASLARQFFLAANGIDDLNEKIPAGNTEDLIGKDVILSLVVYTGKQDGKRKNRIVTIKPIVTRRRTTAKPVVDAAPVVTDEYAAAVASLVEGTDLPSAEAIAATKATLKRGQAPAKGVDDLPF
jgi:hypothetical protein